MNGSIMVVQSHAGSRGGGGPPWSGPPVAPGLSIVVPLFNEAKNLPDLHALLSELVANLAAQRVTGVRGIDDDPALAQQGHGLIDEAPFRIDGMQLEELRHIVFD